MKSIIDHSSLEYQKVLYGLQLQNDNDKGGRSLENAATHSQWIHESILNGKKSSVLDLGCGTGLYNYHAQTITTTMEAFSYSESYFRFGSL